MAGKHGDDTGRSPRGTQEQRERPSSGGSRSDVYDEPPLDPRDPDRGRGTPRHTLHDPEVPDVRFGRNVGDAGRGEGAQRDRYEQPVQGHHAGYGDYGQQDYAPREQRGGGELCGEGGAQSYRGRGPKGYARSDVRLLEVLCEMLTEAPDIDASQIEVKVSGAVVLLDGTVEDRRTRDQVEEMAGQVPGVKEVRNQLRAQPMPEGPDSTSRAG